VHEFLVVFKQLMTGAGMGRVRSLRVQDGSG